MEQLKAEFLDKHSILTLSRKDKGEFLPKILDLT